MSVLAGSHILFFPPKCFQSIKACQEKTKKKTNYNMTVRIQIFYEQYSHIKIMLN